MSCLDIFRFDRIGTGKLIKHLVLTLSFLITITFSSSSFANYCGPWFENLTAPICTDARWIFWTGATVTALVYIDEHDYGSRVRSASLRKRPIKRWSKVGEVIGWGYANGLYFFGSLIAGGTENLKNAEHIAEASGYTLLLTLAGKEVIQEERPDGKGEFDSFPSGHTSMAFAFASVIGIRHGFLWGTLAHLGATFIGYSRIQDDRHYLHDVMAGATLGLSYGWGTYFNHKDHSKPYWFAATPTNDMKGLKLLLAYEF